MPLDSKDSVTECDQLMSERDQTENRPVYQLLCSYDNQKKYALFKHGIMHDSVVVSGVIGLSSQNLADLFYEGSYN